MSETPRVGRPTTGTPVLVRLPEDLIERIDLIASLRASNRAATIRTLLTDAVEEIHMFTVEIQAGSDETGIWQALAPAETAEGDTAQEVAEWTAQNQNVAEGYDWRIVVWDGQDADTGGEPAHIWQPTPAEHHTAWITVDPSCLAGDLADVVVLADKASTYNVDGDGNETPVWESTGMPLLSAETSVRHDGDHDGAKREAVELLAKGGWIVADGWEVVPTGYVATVERA